jgi:Uma2 family endonuclease
MAPPTESNSDAPEPAELPSWAIPPEEGFTADDLDRIPQLPAHTELIDGSLVFVSPQARFHMLIIDLLVAALRTFVPPTHRVIREMTITLDDRQRPEPDLMVVRKEAATSLDQTTFHPEDIALVVEVVSRESRVRDRERKPQLYAESDIPHMWRIENINGEPVVYTFEREPATKTYVATGIHHERLKISVPFDIDIDLTEIHNM